jgi:hypothetical protein
VKIVIKVTLTVEAIVDVEELDAIYTKDCVVDQVKDHIIYGLDRFGIDDVTFNKVDVEQL